MLGPVPTRLQSNGLGLSDFDIRSDENNVLFNSPNHLSRLCKDFLDPLGQCSIILCCIRCTCYESIINTKQQ